MAVLAGAACVAGFAPLGAYPAPILGLAVLFLLLDGAAPRRAFLRGWLFGLGLFGAGISWLQVSIHQFGVPVLAFSAGATAAFVAVAALYAALFAWLGARFAPVGWRRHAFVLPALWLLVEALRAVALSGFPWLEFGFSQIDAPLAGLAPIGGVHAVTLAVALSAGGLAVAWRARGACRLLAVAALAALWLGAACAGRPQWTAPAGPPVRAVIVQGNVEQSLKWEEAARQRTLAHYLALTDPHWGVDLVIWPETAIPAFQVQVGDFLAELARLATASGTDVLAGIPVLDVATRRYYNAVMALGATPGDYRKRHLVPFGEYLPFAGRLGALLDFLRIPMSSFSAGEPDQPLVRAAGHPVGISICYEDVFGPQVRSTLPQAAYLVNVSNDGWFGDSLAPHQHLEMARMRALETGRWLLRATNTGISAFIDPRGRIVARAPQFQAVALVGGFEPRVGATPYVRVGAWPVLALAGVLLVAGGVGRRR